MCRGALVFPQYDHIVYLHPGDIIVFNGAAEWHANMVKPTVGEALRLVFSSVSNPNPDTNVCLGITLAKYGGTQKINSKSRHI